MKLITKLKKINILFLLKTGVGSAVAILLADWLGLAFSPSAGVITLLTIQNTKKETIFVAARRILAFVLANALAYLIFNGFGYTAIAFGGFIFLFVAVCTILGLQDGISMNAVLMTHYLIEKRMNLALIFNEIALLFIGMGLGILLNLIMPRNREWIRREQKALEEEMKNILREMGEALRHKDACLLQKKDSTDKDKADFNEIRIKHTPVDFRGFEKMLEMLIKRAYEEAGNTFFADTKYQVSYFEMRKLQMNVLKDISEKIDQIPVLLNQSIPIAGYFGIIADSFHERNNVNGLLEELNRLYQYFKNEKLPETREEFEYRAILFQILKELEYFLLIKRNFILELEDRNMKTYWN